MRNGKVSANWRTVELREIANIIMGNSPPGESYNDLGNGVPLINGPVEFSEGDLGFTVRGKSTTAPTKMCVAGDLLLCVRGSTTGRTNVAGFDACIGRGVAAIRANEPDSQPYINNFIRTKRQRLFDLGNGSTFPSISQERIAELLIPLPPLAEQKRIAAILDQADAVRRKRQHALQLADDFLRATFLDMFGDPQSNDEKRILQPLGDSLEFVTSGSRGWAKYYAKKGKRFIRSFDVQMNEISSNDMAFVLPPSGTEADRTKVQREDVLLTITGSKIGRVAFIDESIGEAYVSQHVAILRLNGSLRARFLSMYLSMPSGGQAIIGRAQYGQTKPGISLEQIKRFPVPVPPISDQDHFCAVAAKYNEFKHRARTNGQELDRLFNSLVQRAFRGEL